MMPFTKKFKFILALLVCSFYGELFAQDQLGLKVNVGLSNITGTYENYAVGTQSIPAPTGTIGIFYQNQIGRDSYIGTELLFNQIGSREKVYNEFTDAEGNVVGYEDFNSDYHISYLSVPLYYGYRIHHLFLCAGIQGSATLFSAQVQKGIYEYEDEYELIQNRDIPLNIKRFDVCPRVGIIYSVNERLSLEAVYNPGILSIRSFQIPVKTQNIHQVLLGVHIALSDVINLHVNPVYQ